MVEDKNFDSLGAINIVGQRSVIRGVAIQDFLEMQRLTEIDKDPERVKWFESNPSLFHPKTYQELIQFAHNDNNHMLFAVSGWEGVERDEVGRLQGWVKVNPDEQARIEQIKKEGIIELPLSPLILEVSIAKYKDAHHGQMASALRQVCEEIFRISSLGIRDLINQKGEINFPEVIITAYVIPGNEKPIRVLNTSGFEFKGRVQYDQEANEKDLLYILDWDSLHKKLQAATDAKLFPLK